MRHDNQIRWFPMRVTYNREMLMKSHFDGLGIECFVPMKYELGDDSLGSSERLVPAIHNLIFVRSTQETLTELKMTNSDFEPIRYIMNRMENGTTSIITISDREMDNFIKVASCNDRSLTYADDSDYFRKEAKKVRITEGHFKGVVGVVKRIKRNRCVVVRIQGVAAVVIANMPSRFVEEIV